MFAQLLPLVALMGAAQAHMHLHYPPALGGDSNKFTKTPDVLFNYPYGCCQADYASKKWDMGPCRGHLNKLNTDEGRPVATWRAGESIEFQLSGQQIKGTGPDYQNAGINVVGGDHYGGSCQVGMSFDEGKSFQTIATWQGNCPHRGNGIDPSKQKFNVTLPSFLPSKERALFAWSWVNREQEFFMNCASVTIEGNGQAPSPPKSSGQPSKPSGTAQPTKPSSTKPAAAPTGSLIPGKEYNYKNCACKCVNPLDPIDCDCRCDKPSPSSKRHLLEREALRVHKQAMRRAEVNSLSQLPSMQLGFIKGCPPSSFPPKGKLELEFSDPGFNVIDGGKAFGRQESTCDKVF